jgi:hypothetical protein
LVEHPGLVHHDPLPAPDLRVPRRAGVCRTRLGIRVAGVEAGPYAVAVASPSVLVHELRRTVGGNTEFLVGDIGGFLRGCYHARGATFSSGRFDRGPKHGGLARARGALDHYEWVSESDCGGGPGLLRIQPAAHCQSRRIRYLAFTCTRACCKHVAHSRLKGDHMQRGEVRHMLRLHTVGWGHR